PGYATHLLSLGNVSSDRQLDAVALAEGFMLTVTIDARPYKGTPTEVKRARLYRTADAPAAIPFLVEEKTVDDRSVHFEAVEPGSYGVELSGEEPLERVVVPADVSGSTTIEAIVRPLDVTISVSLGDAVRENTPVD